MIYKIIKYGIILIVWIVVLKLAFHDFKPEYLISWNAFSNWWIDTYAGLFKMILSIILGITLIWGIGWLFGNGCMHFSFLFSDIIQNHRYFHELWRSGNTITLSEEV